MENQKLQMIKLVTGEVVMGEEIQTDETVLILKKPMTLMLDPMQGGVGMLPYDAIYTQEENEEQIFEKKYIVHNLKIHPSFADAYFKQTSPIEVPDTEIELTDSNIK